MKRIPLLYVLFRGSSGLITHRAHDTKYSIFLSTFSNIYKIRTYWYIDAVLCPLLSLNNYLLLSNLYLLTLLPTFSPLFYFKENTHITHIWKSKIINEIANHTIITFKNYISLVLLNIQISNSFFCSFFFSLKIGQ